MKITLALTLHIDQEHDPEPEPQGAESLVEHANHDSTPRPLGFTANSPSIDYPTQENRKGPRK